MPTTIQSFLAFLVRPKSMIGDRARREFILNILLLSVIGLFSIALIHNAIEQAFGNENPLALLVLFLPLAFFTGLYALSRAGRSLISAAVFIGTLFLFAGYLSIRWGVDLPASILLHVLIITMAGVLISTRAAFITTGIVVVHLVVIGTLQMRGVFLVDRSWASEGWRSSEIGVASVILLIIATVSWLGNREIERSLARARASEAALKEERDLLEVRVAERTEELRKVELERMSQAYRFVEFGRLAGSIFHDLTSPLTALSLNIEAIAKGAADKRRLTALAADIGRAQTATQHMQKLMGAMRRHLERGGKMEVFSLDQIIRELGQVLGTYASARNIVLEYESVAAVKRYGDPVAFLQAVSNIVTNAIESFSIDGEVERSTRSVKITLMEEGEQAVLRVTDTGPGIPAEVCAHIFEPFFSTKGNEGGLGIGLSLARRIIEKTFGGTITVESVPGKGTTFTVYFPHREP